MADSCVGCKDEKSSRTFITTGLCPTPKPPGPPVCPSSVIDVNQDITFDTVWCGVYRISAEVHVLPGATLTILPESQVLFANGPLALPRVGGTPFATLVVDSGAAINAQGVRFSNELEVFNNTGGLIILGTLAPAKQFEIYTTIVSNPLAVSAQSVLVNVSFEHLGNSRADLNGLTFLQLVGLPEISASNIGITFPGDDGFEIFGGTHIIDRVSIYQSGDDGLDLDGGASLTITGALSIQNYFLPVGALASPLPGLIEVVGSAGTVNTLIVSAGAALYLRGNSTDLKVPGTVLGAGTFAGWTVNTPANYQVLAIAGSTLTGTNP